jgi:hypothetical protein
MMVVAATKTWQNIKKFYNTFLKIIKYMVHIVENF